MPLMTPYLKSHPCIKKIEKPILTKDDIPYDASLIFNAGVAKINGKYVMVFRNDYGTNEELFSSGKAGFKTSVGIAFSDNGIDNWQVAPKAIFDSVRHQSRVKSVHTISVHGLHVDRSESCHWESCR